MNKKILGAGAASAVLATMPLLGVFAEATVPDSVVDDIEITVPASCNLEVAEGKSADIHRTMNVGTVDDNIEGSKFTIACNTDGTWSLKAKGTGEGTANALKAAGEGGEIVSSSDPATNLKVNASTSDWGFQAKYYR